MGMENSGQVCLQYLALVAGLIPSKDRETSRGGARAGGPGVCSGESHGYQELFGHLWFTMRTDGRGILVISYFCALRTGDFK